MNICECPVHSLDTNNHELQALDTNDNHDDDHLLLRVLHQPVHVHHGLGELLGPGVEDVVPVEPCTKG